MIVCVQTSLPFSADSCTMLVWLGVDGKSTCVCLLTCQWQAALGFSNTRPVKRQTGPTKTMEFFMLIKICPIMLHGQHTTVLG